MLVDHGRALAVVAHPSHQVSDADPGEQLSIPVDQDRLGSFGLDLFTGPLDEFAVDEGRSGADQGDEVGRVYRAPAVLC